MADHYRSSADEIRNLFPRQWYHRSFYTWVLLAWIGLGGSMLSAPQLENLCEASWELSSIQGPNAVTDFGTLGTEWCFASESKHLWSGAAGAKEYSWALYGRNLLIRSEGTEHGYRVTLLSSDQLVLRGAGQTFRFHRPQAP